MKNWQFSFFVDGQWDPWDETAAVIEVVDPATEDVIGLVPQGTADDARRAAVAARKAFDEGPWPWMRPADRATVLRRMAESLEARQAELRDLIVAETGSVGPFTDYVQAIGAVGMLRSNADLAEHGFRWVESSSPTMGAHGLGGSAIFREPVGVVTAITPFNFPFTLSLMKVAPALAAGCTVVLKPHPWTPLNAFLIAEAAQEADLPPGVLNVIVGDGAVGEYLTSSALVDMVSMTGSTATGKRIMECAAGTMKRLHLELGGKSAQVVLDDVDEDYVHSIGFGDVVIHCGQGCSLQTRLILPERMLDAYKDGVRAAQSQVTIGDPRDPATTLGPLIRECQRNRVEGYVQSALAEGAELITGGKRPPGHDKGFFFEPTVVIGSNDMRIAQEEVFGPVLTVIPYSGSDSEAIKLANQSVYGLAAGVVSASTARAFNAARQLRAGYVNVRGNAGPDLADPGPGGGQGPGWGEDPAGVGQRGAFGGYKQSGFGREWGYLGLESFTEVKSLGWS